MLIRILSLIVLLTAGPAPANSLLGLPPLKIPENNPQTLEKIILGREIFHDTRLSKDATVSCATCHQGAKAGTDGREVAVGIQGLTGLRNTPSVVNAAFFSHLFHDGRAESLEQQALGPLLNPIEHGFQNSQQVLDILLKDESYSNRLQQIFAVSENEIEVQHIAMVIASYERTLIAGNSAFDQYLFGRDKKRLSESAARGLRVFRRKGNCANCHEISWNNALFSDNRFYNIGVGFKYLQPVLDQVLKAIRQRISLSDLSLSPRQRSELGRFNVTGSMNDIGKFKTPSLRNIALTAPYMHDGSMATLEEVVDYYDRGGNKNRFLDAAIFPLQLSQQEKADLVAFMQALSSAPVDGLD